MVDAIEEIGDISSYMDSSISIAALIRTSEDIDGFIEVMDEIGGRLASAVDDGEDGSGDFNAAVRKCG